MTSAASSTTPLWLSIETKIAELGSSDFDEPAKEATVHKLAQMLDDDGFNVSHHAGHMIMLRHAVDARAAVGRPLFNDYTAAVEELTEEAIRNGKHVVTANKALIAECGNEIFALAQEHGVEVLAEAQAYCPEVPVIMLSSASDMDIVLQAIHQGAFDYVLKDQRLEPLQNSMRLACGPTRSAISPACRCMIPSSVRVG